MKPSFFSLLFLLTAPFIGCCQSGTWVWVNGPDTAKGLGNFGTQGVASVNNSPWALYQAAQWEDKDGNLWLFGGVGSYIDSNGPPYAQELGDLWKTDL